MEEKLELLKEIYNIKPKIESLNKQIENLVILRNNLVLEKYNMVSKVLELKIVSYDMIKAIDIIAETHCKKNNQ